MKIVVTRVPEANRVVGRAASSTHGRYATDIAAVLVARGLP